MSTSFNNAMQHFCSLNSISLGSADCPTWKKKSECVYAKLALEAALSQQVTVLFLLIHPLLLSQFSSVLSPLLNSCVECYRAEFNSSHIVICIDASKGKSEGRRGKLKLRAVRIPGRGCRCALCDGNKRLLFLY